MRIGNEIIQPDLSMYQLYNITEDNKEENQITKIKFNCLYKFTYMSLHEEIRLIMYNFILGLKKLM